MDEGNEPTRKNNNNKRRSEKSDSIRMMFTLN